MILDRVNKKIEFLAYLKIELNNEDTKVETHKHFIVDGMHILEAMKKIKQLFLDKTDLSYEILWIREVLSGSNDWMDDFDENKILYNCTAYLSDYNNDELPKLGTPEKQNFIRRLLESFDPENDSLKSVCGDYSYDIFIYIHIYEEDDEGYLEYYIVVDRDIWVAIGKLLECNTIKNEEICEIVWAKCIYIHDSANFEYDNGTILEKIEKSVYKINETNLDEYIEKNKPFNIPVI